MTNQYYENAKAKGFHDEDIFGPDGTPDARTRIVFSGLLTTEWREQKIDAASVDPKWRILEDGKPCGELSEWADIWIHCADSLGACGESLVGREYDVQSERKNADYVPWAVALAIECARQGDHENYAAVLRSVMNYAMHQMASLCLNRESLPPPSEAVRVKHEYNKTRTRRHDKLA